MSRRRSRNRKSKSLIDAKGKSVKKQVVFKEQATPTVGGVRPVISGHPAEGLDPIRLAYIHREAAAGEPLSYFELAEDIEERDLHYSGVLSTRKRSVAQLPITVSPASESSDHKKQADFVRSWINDEVLQDGLFDMLDAIGKGMSVMEIDWRYHLGNLYPAKLEYRPQRWFTFDPDDGNKVMLLEGTSRLELPPHKFVIHEHPSKSGLTIRSGLARVASWAWMFKQFTLKDWAIFTQNYGQPIRVGRYGRNATEEEKDILWRAVTGIAGDCAAIMPADMEVEFVSMEGKGATVELYERRADWMDRQISKAVLGQTTTTDAVSGGHAVAKEHRLVQEDIERSDAKMISTTVNRQIIPNLVAFNFGPQEIYPKVKIGRPDEPDLETFSNAFSNLAPQGLTAPMGWLRERLSIPAPKDGEEVVGGKIMTGPSRNVEDEDLNPPDDKKKKEPKLNSKSLHASEVEKDTVDHLTDRLAGTAGSAIDAMTDEVRSILAKANTLEEVRDQLDQLQLDTTEFSNAMAEAMSLAHLASQAALVDEIDNDQG